MTNHANNTSTLEGNHSLTNMISFHNTKISGKDGSKFSKDFHVLDSESVGVIAETILQKAWSPIIWKDGIRKASNFIEAHWLVLDFDDGEMTLGQARQEFKDHTCIIGTTMSHTSALHKFRVALKFTIPCTDRDDYIFTLKNAIKHYPADRQCADAGRFFFPCKDLYHIEETGCGADVFEDRGKGLKDALVIRPRKHRILPERIQFLLDSKWIEGERNNTAFRVAMSMMERGYTKLETMEAICLNNNFSAREIDNVVKSAANILTKEGRI